MMCKIKRSFLHNDIVVAENLCFFYILENRDLMTLTFIPQFLHPVYLNLNSSYLALYINMCDFLKHLCKMLIMTT